MKKLLKRISAKLPRHWQQFLKRAHVGRQVRSGDFSAGEPEFDQLEEMVTRCDWVIDIGANIGHYTARMSALVGDGGRVISFEPIPETFALLTTTCSFLAHKNITLINAAASDRQESLRMEIPKSERDGTTNYYQARLSDAGSISVLSISVDSLNIEHPIRLIKIDVEGHEFSVISGMKALLSRDHPQLIVEGDQLEVELLLKSLGYDFRTLPGSWNRIYMYTQRG